ncbi:GNAT family N-acetyltransferase [Winogradskyella ursingii]|uniref:GNAT family N-acetyltransferase n=1 Tax=Winogradskyella ursingii TaxID=2686079 RepID=UPI0015C95346|nr:GNAT family N-acetyltransferase [Winogradskyella ursingii]
MEVGEKGLSERVIWLKNIIKNGLFLHGVRNNLAKIGLDFMPYYLFKSSLDTTTPQYIKGDKLDLKLSVFGEPEVNYVKNAIIGIEGKDLLQNLKNGETCIGIKHNDEIVAYSFMRRQPFYFRKRYFHLGENDSYFHSTYVFENYRGKNIAPYLRYQRFNLLEKQGVLYHYSISEYFNKSAIKFQKKTNAQTVALYLSVILFNKWTMNFTLKNY